MSTCGALRTMAARAAAVVSPVRRAVRIAGAGRPRSERRVADAGERGGQVLLDVAAEGLEGRDVDDVDPLAEVSRPRAVDQRVERGQEGGQRLARSGGRGDERVAPGQDLHPAALLRLRGRVEGALEPRADGRMKREGKGHGRRRCAITLAPSCAGRVRGRIERAHRRGAEGRADLREAAGCDSHAGIASLHAAHPRRRAPLRRRP